MFAPANTCALLPTAREYAASVDEERPNAMEWVAAMVVDVDSPNANELSPLAVVDEPNAKDWAPFATVDAPMATALSAVGSGLGLGAHCKGCRCRGNGGISQCKGLVAGFMGE